MRQLYYSVGKVDERFCRFDHEYNGIDSLARALYNYGLDGSVRFYWGVENLVDI